MEALYHTKIDGSVSESDPSLWCTALHCDKFMVDVIDLAHSFSNLNCTQEKLQTFGFDHNAFYDNNRIKIESGWCTLPVETSRTVCNILTQTWIG